MGVESVEGSNIAASVLNPKDSTDAINNYWADYLALPDSSALQLSVPRPSGNGNTTVLVYKNTHATQQNYVDEYFHANNSAALTNAFASIVNEIILQSRYYPTHLEGGHPDFSGYLTFEDKIGEYMEIKDIKGILLGSTLFDGHAFASKLNDSAAGGLGTIENPTVLGLEFSESVKTRLGIADNTTAFALIRSAYESGQLGYVSDTNYSNYIGWYAKADGSYLGFYNEGTTTAPADAVYKIRSYGLLGQATGNIKDSDMMYMTIQVRTNIETGEQTLIWKIPAALIPIVTYKVTLQGTSVAAATNVEVTRQTADPIRLVFEVGLQSHINELNVSEITDSKHVAADGSRIFWTNYWDNSAAEHEDHVTTIAGFTPSEQNEKYYYAADSVIYQKSGDTYLPVTDANHQINTAGEYYHANYVFSNSSTGLPELYYERIAAVTLEKAEWSATYEVNDSQNGAWIIPIGTVYQLISDKYFVPKGENVTQSIHFSNYPYLTHTNTSYEADAKLGNNGLLKVVPATGIKLSKTIDVVEPGASDTFRFRITLTDADGVALTGTYDTMLAELDRTDGQVGTLTPTGGVVEVDLQAGHTFYLTGLPDGAKYHIEEVGDNAAYKVKTVHVNGMAVAGTVAAGTITARALADVDFLNTPVSEGNLVITKQVNHPYGSDYVIPANISFTAVVTLKQGNDALAGETYDLVRAGGTQSVTTDANGQLKLALKAGETVSLQGISEQVAYTISETAMPDGFTLDAAASTALTGQIAADGNIHATLVNSYAPDGVSPDDGEVMISINKQFSGREWSGDAFEFVIEELAAEAGAANRTVATVTIDSAAQPSKLYDLTNEYYDRVGTYHYRVTEVVGSATNGIAYDTLERRFHVDVSDTDMDGKLEIVHVSNVMNTVVTEQNGDYTVETVFSNTYAAYAGSSVEIEVNKQMAGHTFPLNGFKFGLYDLTEQDELLAQSTLTDANGKAHFNLYYPADAVGEHKYLLKEIAGNLSGMAYSDKAYSVTVTVTDNGDGTTSASAVITDGTAALSAPPVFVNTYTPTAAVYVVSGNKQLTGRTQNAGEFEFELYRVDHLGEHLVESVKNAYNGDFIFETLVFNVAGDYRFVVKEKQGNLGGVAYDGKSYDFTVTVADENGVLVATSDLNEAIVFNNTYTAAAAEVTITADKILTGRDIANGEFEFTLTRGSYSDTKPNEGGKVTFDKLIFDTAGRFIYTITEIGGNLGGVTYDDAVYKVIVTVTDDGDGQLHAAVSYEKDGLASSGIVFRNSYLAQPYDIVIGGNKQLVGRGMNAGEFEFALRAALSGNTLRTAKNDEYGNYSFDPVTVHSAGSYHLQVLEVNTELGGVSYDTSIYDIIVTVEDNGNGLLVETARVITKNGADVNSSAIDFGNTYKAAALDFTLGGQKVLDGRDLDEGEFTFELYHADMGEGGLLVKKGDAVDSDDNDADGKFEFELRYEEAATYYYVVVEKRGILGGVIYDETEYSVIVTVTDNLDGTMSAATEIKTADGTADQIVFNNSYEIADTVLVISGTKTLTGRDMVAGEFTFKLFEANENYVAAGDAIDTATNTGDGKFSFGSIDITDIGTLYYVVTEDDSANEAGMTYDDTVYRIKVTVTDNGDGTYKVDTDISTAAEADAEGILFANLYNKPTPDQPVLPPKTGDFSNPALWAALLFVSGFGLVALGKKSKKTEN